VTKEVFRDHVNQERIFSNYVDRRGGDIPPPLLTMRFGEEVMENLHIHPKDGKCNVCQNIFNIRCGSSPKVNAVDC
jgi:hypothetical protein